MFDKWTSVIAPVVIGIFLVVAVFLQIPDVIDQYNVEDMSETVWTGVNDICHVQTFVLDEVDKVFLENMNDNRVSHMLAIHDQVDGIEYCEIAYLGHYMKEEYGYKIKNVGQHLCNVHACVDMFVNDIYCEDLHGADGKLGFTSGDAGWAEYCYTKS